MLCIILSRLSGKPAKWRMEVGALLFTRSPSPFGRLPTLTNHIFKDATSCDCLGTFEKAFLIGTMLFFYDLFANQRACNLDQFGTWQFPLQTGKVLVHILALKWSICPENPKKSFLFRPIPISLFPFCEDLNPRPSKNPTPHRILELWDLKWTATKTLLCSLFWAQVEEKIAWQDMKRIHLSAVVTNLSGSSSEKTAAHHCRQLPASNATVGHREASKAFSEAKSTCFKEPGKKEGDVFCLKKKLSMTQTKETFSNSSCLLPLLNSSRPKSFFSTQHLSTVSAKNKISQP